MKKLSIIFLCLILTGCTYLGDTDSIRISSPHDLAISRIETFGETPLTTPQETSGEGTTVSTETPNQPDSPAGTTAEVKHLILSLKTKKIHYFDDCSYAKKLKPVNRKVVDTEDEALLLIEGYTVCSFCAKHKGS